MLPELLGLRAQLDQVRHSGDLWQQRAETLERDLRITSVHLLFVVVRVLGSDQGARAELARLWSCLEPSERQRMLPAVTAAIVEPLHKVLEETSPSRYARERDLEVVANAEWLIKILLGRGDEEIPDSRRERVNMLLVAARAHISITQRGKRPGRSRENPPPMSKVPAAKDSDPAHGGDDLQQPLTEAPQREAASGEGADHDPYIGREDRRPTPTLEGQAVGLGIPSSPQTVEQLKSRAGAVSSTDPTQIAELDDDHLGAVAYGELPATTTPLLTTANVTESDASCSAVPPEASPIRSGVVSGPVRETDAPATRLAVDPAVYAAEVEATEPTVPGDGNAAE